MQLSLFGAAPPKPAPAPEPPQATSVQVYDLAQTRRQIVAANFERTQRAHQIAQARPLRERVGAWLEVLAAGARLRRATARRMACALGGTRDDEQEARAAWFAAWRQEGECSEEFQRRLLAQSPAKLLTLPELTRSLLGQVLHVVYPDTTLCPDDEHHFDPFKEPLRAQSSAVRDHLLLLWFKAKANPHALAAGYDLMRGRLALCAFGLDFDDDRDVASLVCDTGRPLS